MYLSHFIGLIFVALALCFAPAAVLADDLATPANAQDQDVSPPHFEPKDAIEQASSVVGPVEPTIAAPAFELFGSDHRQRIYDEARLSHGTAALYSLALPGLGNIYTQQYLLAGVAFTMMAFSTVFIAFGLHSSRPDVVWMGAGSALITYTGSMASSLYGVSDYNRLLREGLKISEFAPRAGPSFVVSFRF